MSALHSQIRRTLQRHRLCPPGSRVLVGLSGGSDSVALARILVELAPSGGFEVVGLAHLNHRLRPTAGRDESFCVVLARDMGLPLDVESADVTGYAASQQLSIEDAARRLRYDFLGRAAARLNADRIAVGHTLDDQAETFLLKLMRGAGLKGLAGVYPRRGAVVRPLLDVSRGSLRAYLASVGQEWVEDESNADLSNPRNRIRHRVLPELDAAYGGPTRASLARAADLSREDTQWLDELAGARYRELVVSCQDCVEIDALALLAEPAPIRRRILLQAMRSRAGGREVGLDHVEAALAVLRGDARATEVPGCRWELRRGKLVLLDQGGRSR